MQIHSRSLEYVHPFSLSFPLEYRWKVGHLSIIRAQILAERSATREPAAAEAEVLAELVAEALARPRAQPGPLKEAATARCRELVASSRPRRIGWTGLCIPPRGIRGAVLAWS
jgi:hypothetical protein